MEILIVNKDLLKEPVEIQVSILKLVMSNLIIENFNIMAKHCLITV